jgi:hypothetical protein|tara:strand:- start:335 stop:820 length:486 start_codon:yes stop_codon:yes gene_type:complete
VGKSHIRVSSTKIDLTKGGFDMAEAMHIDNFYLSDKKNILVKNYEKAKKELEDFNKILEDRFIEEAKEQLHIEGKDFGTAVIFDGNRKVKVELRKRVEWDQEGLKDFFNSIPEEEAIHYAKVSFSITESRFNNATPDLQSRMQEHRTVKLQSVKVTFEENE